MVIFFGSLTACGHHNIIMWKQQCQHLAKHPLWKKNHGFGTIWVRVKDDSFHFRWNIITTRYHIFSSINRKVETKKTHYLNIPNKTTITQNHWVYKTCWIWGKQQKFPFKETSLTNKHLAGPPMLKESQSLISTSLQWFITLDSDHPKSRNPLTTATLPHSLRDEEVMMNVCSLVITILIIFQRAGGRVLAFHLRFYWVTLSWSARGRCCRPEL